MAINIKEYREKYPTRVVVTLEEGVDFEIRKLTPVDLWSGKLDKENPTEFVRTVLLKGVVNPPLSETEKEGFLCLNEVTSEHQNKLMDEIISFSGFAPIKPKGENTDFLSQSNTPSTSMQ